VEWVVGLLVVAAVFAVRQLAIRRVAKGDRRFFWLYFAPTLIIFTYLIWIAIGMWKLQPVLAIGLGLLAVVSLVLLVRMIRGMAMVGPPPESLGELASPSFDYIVWLALGAPMLLVVLLLILLVTGGLTTSR